MTRRSTCRQCGERDDQVGRISRSGLCAGCGLDNQRSFNRQMTDKRGPAYNAWLKRYLAATAVYHQQLQADIDERARRMG